MSDDARIRPKSPERWQQMYEVAIEQRDRYRRAHAALEIKRDALAAEVEQLRKALRETSERNTRLQTLVDEALWQERVAIRQALIAPGAAE